MRADRRHAHTGRIVLSAAVVFVGAGYLAFRLVIPHRGDSTPLSLDEVRSRFEASTSIVITASTTTSTPNAPSPLPAPGVYVYATTGHDSVDALNGDHHEYPATTTITVTPTDCGVLERWDALRERWEEWDRCVEDNGSRQLSRTTFDSFFGQDQKDVYTCTGQPRPLDAPVASTWVTTCARGDDVEIHRGEVVGRETTTVGATKVPTLHVRVTITNARPSDRQIFDTWYEIGTELIVAHAADIATSNSSPIGTVHYEESYQLRLTSLQPIA